jgi:hypothetical protein
VVLVLEHCGAGDLHGILAKHGGRISERMCVRKVLAPLLTALQVCVYVSNRTRQDRQGTAVNGQTLPAWVTAALQMSQLTGPLCALASPCLCRPCMLLGLSTVTSSLGRCGQELQSIMHPRTCKTGPTPAPNSIGQC